MDPFRIFLRLFKKDKNKLPTPLANTQRWRDKGVEIGENTCFYGSVIIGRNGKDPVKIGRNCVLTNCTILGHDASTNLTLGIKRSMIQPVIIDDDCFIGFQSIILMGVRIGKGSIVGAGSVVTKDVPPGMVVAGNPAKVLCSVGKLVEKRKAIAKEHPEYFPDLPDSLI